MTAPVTDPAGDVQEFHPITIGLAEDTTDVTCAGCGFAEHTGSGQDARGAHHVIVTGHTVTERHVRTTVISEHPVPGAS